MREKSIFWIAVTICVAGAGLILWGILWLFYQIGKLVWG